MKAAVWYKAQDVRVEDVPVGSPGQDEVTLDIAYNGICGSDLHEYLDGPHAIPVSAPHPESGRMAPLTMGHEFCGTVAEVGKGVTGVTPGTPVAVEPNYRCFTCVHCTAGEYNLCDHFGFAGLMGDGGLAERVVLPSYMLYPLPENVSLEQAAIFEPAGVALHAVRRAALNGGETVAIVGCGPIGLLIAQLALRYGAERVIASDPSPSRREVARRLGAEVVDAGALPEAAAHVAIEAVGTEGTLTDCLRATRRGGRVILVGLGGRFSFDAWSLVNREQSIIASCSYRDVYPELIRLVAEEGVDFTQIVTSTVPLDDVVRKGFRALLDAKDEIKILVHP